MVNVFKNDNENSNKEEKKHYKAYFKKLGVDIDRINHENKSMKNFEETTQDEMTPRLDNPISLFQKNKSIEGADAIPNERLGPIKLIPILPVHNLHRIKLRNRILTMRNRSRSRSKSNCSFVSKSLASHE